MLSDKDDAEREIGVLVLVDAVDPMHPSGSGASLKVWSRIWSRMLRPGSKIVDAEASGVTARIEGRRSEGPSIADGPTTRRGRPRKTREEVPYLDENKILRIGAKRLAIAINWRTVQDDVSIRETGEALSADGTSMDLFVRRGKVPQVGFASSTSGLSQGDRVAATSFDFASSENWFAAFEVSQSSTEKSVPLAWWLVGYKEGLVCEDRLVFDELTARAALEDRAAEPGWERLIAPITWQLPYAQGSTLGALISPKAAYKLRRTSPIRAYAAPIVLVLVFLGMASGGYMYWYNLRQEELLLLEMEQRRLEEARQASLRIPPWVATPTVSGFLGICTDAIHRNLLFSPGWGPGEFLCSLEGDRVSFRTSWSRAGGRAAWILAAARSKNVNVSLDASLQTAGVAEQIPFTPREELEVEALPGDLIERTLRLRFDSLSLDVSLTRKEARPTPTNNTEQSAPIWNFHEVSFQTSGDLSEFLALLSDIPGIVPDRLTYNIQVHEWTLSLRVYHQLNAATP